MIRVAHVLGKFDQGGVEMLLKEIFLNTDSSKIKLYFVLLDEGKGYYDEELLSNGAQLVKIPIKKGYLNFAKEFTKFLKEKKINAVHSHVQVFTGFILRIAKKAGVNTRFAHSHSDETVLNANPSLLRKAYLSLGRFFVNKYATLKIACSTKAGVSLYGNNKFELLYNGINHEKFESPSLEKKRQYVEELKLNPSSKFIGHVGRFEEVKNHQFILKIAKELKKIDDSFQWIFCGSGTLEEQIKTQIIDSGLEHQVKVVGPRKDIPLLMSHLFDEFIMTSFYEGLPLVMVEAQFAGLPCIIPNHISKEVEVFPELVTYASLEEDPKVWAHKLIKMMSNVDDSVDYAQKANTTDFTLINMLDTLEKWYNRY